MGTDFHQIWHRPVNFYFYWLNHNCCIPAASDDRTRSEVISLLTNIFSTRERWTRWNIQRTYICIHVCTLKAVRQLNATCISRVSKYLNTKSKSVLWHNFVASNFNYWPLDWQFYGLINNNSLAKIQERSLRNLLNDYELDVHDLLDSIGGQTFASRRLQYMLLKVIV